MELENCDIFVVKLKGNFYKHKKSIRTSHNYKKKMQFNFYLRFESSDDSKHLPQLKQKSKILVRVSTLVSSDSDKTSSSEDETDKKPSWLKDAKENLQRQRPLRIWIKVGLQKSEIKKNKLPVNV